MNPIYYQFPEAYWPPVNPTEYLKQIKEGYDRMSNSNVVICGLARNLGPLIDYTACRIKHLSKLFRHSEVIIYSNDNTDSTPYSLRCYGYNVVEEKLGKIRHGPTQDKSRYKDMAYYRNEYLKRAKPILTGLNQKHSYLIVLDTDLYGGYSYDGIANSFYHIDLGCIGSNGLIYEKKEDKLVRLHYDCLAFRRLNSTGVHPAPEINLQVYHRGEDLVPVDSCFGGLAIYKVEDIIKDNVWYTGDDCDHVTLHKELKKNGVQCYLNPSMINLYSEGHYNQ